MEVRPEILEGLTAFRATDDLLDSCSLFFTLTAWRDIWGFGLCPTGRGGLPGAFLALLWRKVAGSRLAPLFPKFGEVFPYFSPIHKARISRA